MNRFRSIFITKKHDFPMGLRSSRSVFFALRGHFGDEKTKTCDKVLFEFEVGGGGFSFKHGNMFYSSNLGQTS